MKRISFTLLSAGIYAGWEERIYESAKSAVDGLNRELEEGAASEDILDEQFGWYGFDNSWGVNDVSDDDDMLIFEVVNFGEVKKNLLSGLPVTMRLRFTGRLKG